ncbi:MAG: hypothetical protein KGV56_03850 [Gammaproteobacteria bacterium]|nr:hypothetical protein [Gammaproteobacteria bacterium]
MWKKYLIVFSYFVLCVLFVYLPYHSENVDKIINKDDTLEAILGVFWLSMPFVITAICKVLFWHNETVFRLGSINWDIILKLLLTFIFYGVILWGLLAGFMIEVISSI